MKKVYMAAGFAALAMLASCSKNNVEPVQAPDNNTDWVDDESVPVPVTFASGALSVETKAMIGSFDELKNQKVGIYALNTVNKKLTWNPTDAATYIDGMKNGEFTIGNDGNINTGKYYPMSGNNTYSFYGYYPYSASVTENENQCYVDYSLGETDILWASDHAKNLTDGTTGFNARYVRAVKEQNLDTGGSKLDYVANLAFNHVLTALEFTVLSDEELEEETLTVKSIELTEVDTKARLYIAATETSGKMDGTVEAVADNKGTLAVPHDGEPVVPTTEGVAYGTLMLLAGESYTGNITITFNSQDNVIPINITTKNTDNQFKAGYKYSLKLKVKSPVEVVIETTLVDWVAAGDEDEIEVG